MSYARKWHLDPIFSSSAILLRREPIVGSRPVMLFDVANENNITDAYDAVYRALQALTKNGHMIDDADRADAVLVALGIAEKAENMVPELVRRRA